MNCNRIFIALAYAAFVAAPAVAGDNEQEISTKIVGMGSYEVGEVEKGGNRLARDWETSPFISHAWYQRAYWHLGVVAQLNEQIRMDIIGEAKVTYSWRIQQEFYDDLVPKYYFYPHHMEGSYIFGDPEKPLLRLGAGIFPYKYNPDVRNLGEYLFRTGTYPGFMISEFDFPLTRMTGFRASVHPIEDLNFDLMLINDPIQLPPLGDWGISMLGDYTLLKAITIGGGVFFSHLFSVCEEYTTPRYSTNVSYIDSVTNDTTFYTFRGTKVMARLAFDPKPLLGDMLSFMGKNDLRLYAEAAIIGLKDYKGYYDTLLQRIPVTVGFNVPTFKLLDVLSVEAEYYDSKIPNSYQEVYYKKSQPIPDVARMNDLDWDQNRDNHLKWSVYANRRLANFFTICGEVAFDHTRLLRHDQKNADIKATGSGILRPSSISSAASANHDIIKNLFLRKRFFIFHLSGLLPL